MGWRVWRNSGDILSLGGVSECHSRLGESDNTLFPHNPTQLLLRSYQGIGPRFKTGALAGWCECRRQGHEQFAIATNWFKTRHHKWGV